MKTDNLKSIDQAPKSGTCLVYTRKEVIFKDYDNLDGLKDELKKYDLLEIHLFDEDKEYRAVSSESSRYPEQMIEYVSDFKYDPHNPDQMGIYEETCLLESGGSIKILNSVCYDENGMAFIDDFRMVKGGRV